MKLFKKRETAQTGVSSNTSPASSLEKSGMPIRQQSPTPSPANPTATVNSAPVPATTGNARDPAMQYPWSSRQLSNDNPFPRYGHATNAQSGKVSPPSITRTFLAASWRPRGDQNIVLKADYCHRTVAYTSLEDWSKMRQ